MLQWIIQTPIESGPKRGSGVRVTLCGLSEPDWAQESVKEHIVPEDDSNQKTVTVEIDWNSKCFGFLRASAISAKRVNGWHLAFFFFFQETLSNRYQ